MLKVVDYIVYVVFKIGHHKRYMSFLDAQHVIGVSSYLDQMDISSGNFFVPLMYGLPHFQII